MAGEQARAGCAAAAAPRRGARARTASSFSDDSGNGTMSRQRMTASTWLSDVSGAQSRFSVFTQISPACAQWGGRGAVSAASARHNRVRARAPAARARARALARQRPHRRHIRVENLGEEVALGRRRRVVAAQRQLDAERAALVRRARRPVNVAGHLGQALAGHPRHARRRRRRQRAQLTTQGRHHGSGEGVLHGGLCARQRCV